MAILHFYTISFPQIQFFFVLLKCSTVVWWVKYKLWGGMWFHKRKTMWCSLSSTAPYFAKGEWYCRSNWVMLSLEANWKINPEVTFAWLLCLNRACSSREIHVQRWEKEGAAGAELAKKHWNNLCLWPHPWHGPWPPFWASVIAQWYLFLCGTCGFGLVSQTTLVTGGAGCVQLCQAAPW